MGKANVGSAADVAVLAFYELVEKLTEEAKLDAAVALTDLTKTQRAQIYFLATGGMNRSALKAATDLTQQRKLMELAAAGAQPRRLQLHSGRRR